MLNNQKYQNLNIAEEDAHKGKITPEILEVYTEGFTKPALFRNMAPIEKNLDSEDFFKQIDGDLELQWRIKSDDAAVSMRSKDGESDYNYVTGKVGTGKEFLNDIFSKKIDVYSHLGTISSGYSDPYPWGKDAFNKVKESIFSNSWFDVPDWVVTGHMFFGNSTQQFGEPAKGAVGSDWHMFPTLNIFVMIAGEKKWTTRPPKIGDQYKDYHLMFLSSSGREAPAAHFEADTFTLKPGDVLINPPFEWHKVLNAKGLTIGAAFRVIDKKYLKQLEGRKNLDLNRVDIEADFVNNEELAHFLTSVSYASKDLKRAQMLLNDIEYAYLRKKEPATTIEIAHK